LATTSFVGTTETVLAAVAPNSQEIEMLPVAWCPRYQQRFGRELYIATENSRSSNYLTVGTIPSIHMNTQIQSACCNYGILGSKSRNKTKKTYSAFACMDGTLVIALFEVPFRSIGRKSKHSERRDK
jgi:hypothetical protein